MTGYLGNATLGNIHYDVAEPHLAGLMDVSDNTPPYEYDLMTIYYCYKSRSDGTTDYSKYQHVYEDYEFGIEDKRIGEECRLLERQIKNRLEALSN